VHELDLPFCHLAAVLLVVVGCAVEVQVLRVDGLLVDELVLLGGEVLDPVVPLRLARNWRSAAMSTVPAT